MKIHKLRQKDISSLPPGIHSDGLNLVLSVRGDNSRSWVFRKAYKGREYWIGLGSANAIPLVLAREIADGYRRKFAKGDIGDLGLDKSGKESPEKPAAGPAPYQMRLFRDVFPGAVENERLLKRWKNVKHYRQWLSTIETYAVPVIGDMDITEITKHDILKILEPIWSTKTETARRLQQRLRIVFDYFIAKEWLDGPNPAAWQSNLAAFLPPASKVLNRRHFRSLDWRKTPELAAKFNRPDIGYLCSLFGILTAARAREFTGIRWEEVDLTQKLWILPAARRKGNRTNPHRIPLSDQAVEILKKMGPRPSGFIFRSRAACGHINPGSPRILLKRSAGEEITAHGFRSTFMDWGTDNGYDQLALEKCLSHETGNETTQAYRRSDMLETRAKIMQDWADFILPPKEKDAGK